MFVRPGDRRLLYHPSSQRDRIRERTIVFPIRVPSGLSNRYPRNLFVVFGVLCSRGRPFLSLAALTETVLQYRPRLNLFSQTIFAKNMRRRILHALLLPVVGSQISRPPTYLRDITANVRDQVTRRNVRRRTFVNVKRVILQGQVVTGVRARLLRHRANSQRFRAGLRHSTLIQLSASGRFITKASQALSSRGLIEDELRIRSSLQALFQWFLPDGSVRQSVTPTPIVSGRFRDSMHLHDKIEHRVLLFPVTIMLTARGRIIRVVHLVQARDTRRLRSLIASQLQIGRQEQLRHHGYRRLRRVILSRITRDPHPIVVFPTVLRTGYFQNASLSQISMVAIPRQFRCTIKRARGRSILRHLFPRVVICAMGFLLVRSVSRVLIRAFNQFRTHSRELLRSRTTPAILTSNGVRPIFFRTNQSRLMRRQQHNGVVSSLIQRLLLLPWLVSAVFRFVMSNKVDQVRHGMGGATRRAIRFSVIRLLILRKFPSVRLFRDTMLIVHVFHANHPRSTRAFQRWTPGIRFMRQKRRLPPHRITKDSRCSWWLVTYYFRLLFWFGSIEAFQGPRGSFFGTTRLPGTPGVVFRNNEALQGLRGLFLEFSRDSGAMRSSTVHTQGHVTSFPDPVNIRRVAAFTVNAFVDVNSGVITLDLGRVHYQVRHTRPVGVI